MESSMTKVMIYGASGYTGRMATEHARTAGLDVVVAGLSEAPLVALGGAYRVFSVDDPAAIDTALADIAVLLNFAGPFLHTAEPLMRAAIRKASNISTSPPSWTAIGWPKRSTPKPRRRA